MMPLLLLILLLFARAAAVLGSSRSEIGVAASGHNGESGSPRSNRRKFADAAMARCGVGCKEQMVEQQARCVESDCISLEKVKSTCSKKCAKRAKNSVPLTMTYTSNKKDCKRTCKDKLRKERRGCKAACRETNVAMIRNCNRACVQKKKQFILQGERKRKEQTRTKKKRQKREGRKKPIKKGGKRTKKRKKPRERNRPKQVAPVKKKKPNNKNRPKQAVPECDNILELVSCGPEGKWFLNQCRATVDGGYGPSSCQPVDLPDQGPTSPPASPPTTDAPTLRTDLPTTSRVVEILDRFRDANNNRDHVMVVAHRGGWWKDGEIVMAENSLSAVELAVNIGAEMVELDVQKTFDGVYVILHDTTLDRTTTCWGSVAYKTLEEVRQCNLVIEGNDFITDEVVPTLEEAFEAIRGRILMNVDIKLGVDELYGVMEIAQTMGVESQILIKYRTGTLEEVEAARSVLKKISFPVLFMPLLDDRDISDSLPIERVYETFSPEAVEALNRWVPGTPITQDGGINFSVEALELAQVFDTHLWINTLWQGLPATISGGRGDYIAVGSGDVQNGWGFWVEAGATIIQTDEPVALMEFLSAKGHRKAYRKGGS